MSTVSQLNPYEAGTQKVIPAVLVYVFHENQVLMIHRNSASSTQKDEVRGIWNGLGGKCELAESPLEAAQREVFEESGLNIPQSQFRALGAIQFPHFKPHKNEDWMVFIFTVDLAEMKSQVKTSNSEGELHWVSCKEVPQLNLWPGDLLFMPYVMGRIPFMGTLWYEKGQVTRHWLQKL